MNEQESEPGSREIDTEEGGERTTVSTPQPQTDRADTPDRAELGEESEGAHHAGDDDRDSASTPSDEPEGNQLESHRQRVIRDRE